MVLGQVFLRITNPSPLELQEPQSILLLIDTSQSMAEDGKLGHVKAAAKNIINQQKHPQDDFSLIRF